MSTRRVVITGMGWVTPLGHDVESVWARLLAGESGVGPVTRFDARTLATNFAAEVRDFELADFVGPERAGLHERAGLSTKFAIAACEQAWKQAGFASAESGAGESPDPERVGIYIGAGEGSLDYERFVGTNLAGWDAERRTVDAVAWAEAALGPGGMTAAGELEQEPNLTISHLAVAFGARGPAFNCMTACAASTQAAGEATEMIRRGDADVMIAGGSHTMVHPLGMTGFIRLTAMSTRRDDPATASRPFDATRDGFVMGEGAGIVILEELEHAKARGATILAEVAGYGSTADAFRITDIHPDGKGGARAMRRALAQAGIDPHAVGEDGRPLVHYINAHGTGTKENDKTETAGVKSVFGELAPRVPFGSVKSMLGHLIQAAGAVEMMTCVQAIRTGILPPTINLTHPDPACDLDHIPGVPRDLREVGGVRTCVSSGFGFGGQNDCVCLKRYEDN